MWALTASLCAFALYATSTVSDNVAEKHAKDRKYEATGFTKDAGIRKGDSVVLGDDVEWGLRMAQAYEVYWGRVWTQDLKDGGTPRAGATAVLLKLPEPYATPESSWPGAPMRLGGRPGEHQARLGALAQALRYRPGPVGRGR